MRAALVTHEGVDLVDDQCAYVSEGRPEPLAREQDVERLGRGDQDVRRPARHGLARGGQRVAGADRHAHLGKLQPVGRRGGPDPRQRGPEILLDVVVQRTERRDVDDVDTVLQPLLEPETVEVIERPEERGEGLARARRGDDQGVAPRGDRLPAFTLRACRLAEGVGEPPTDEREELGHRAHCTRPGSRMVPVTSGWPRWWEGKRQTRVAALAWGGRR